MRGHISSRPSLVRKSHRLSSHSSLFSAVSLAEIEIRMRISVEGVRGSLWVSNKKRAMLFTSQREQIRFRDERLHRVRAKLPKVHSNSCAPLRIGNYKQSSQYLLHHLLSRGVFHLNTLNVMIIMNCSLKKFNKIR